MEQRDIPQVSEWLAGTKDNLADNDVLGYPGTQVLCAHADQPIAYMPVQPTLTLESLAINPEGSHREVAEALKQLTKATVLIAHTKGIKEIYFVCKDDSTADFALRHGFEELPFRTLRLKLNTLEGSPECASPQESL